MDQQQHIQFVTGRLAEHALRSVVKQLAAEHGFGYSITVLPITVAALMSPVWIAKHLTVDPKATRIILPGYCHGELTPLHELTSQTIEVGPKDLRRLPEYFGGKSQAPADYGKHEIQILAEINHAPKFARAELLTTARRLKAAGADLIDVGCIPGYQWNEVGDVVRMLTDEGLAVSIDSLDPNEIGPAVKSGAELVLSVNATNREAAVDWGCEVVVIPDEFSEMKGLDQTIDYLASRSVRLRVDPILEPIGFGFAASLKRYMDFRSDYPDAEIMMGIGNITELTDCDSAGINLILLAICQELGIRSVLTTQVINWARTSVAECDIARQLVYHSIENRVPPKRLDKRLVTLRDSSIVELGSEAIEALASQIKDNNFRIFAEQDNIHLVGKQFHLQDADPFTVFDQLADSQPKNLDASHAFYLGYEMCKAMMALQLGKEYHQDEALDWGYLTVDEEDRHRLKLRKKSRPSN